MQSICCRERPDAFILLQVSRDILSETEFKNQFNYAILYRFFFSPGFIFNFLLIRPFVLDFPFLIVR